ncbi:hypothetical protein EJB05_38643 [Eragrostis curvula]|uniref:cyanoalanine nitrilase n=1 Tax=Eragrostis curvula TaxID=38414 RepID=A0A5J9TWB5_9POAL|nr:hypothetical protein EJB05_38643 [Eragrostis curvula]
MRVEEAFAEMDMNAGDEPAAAFATVRATVVQASTVFYDTPATIEKAGRLIAEAAEQGAQLVVFPETFVGGFPRGTDFGVTIGGPAQAKGRKGKDVFCKYYASAITVPGPETSRLASFAAEHGVYVVMGAVERDGHTLYNAVLFFSPAGELLGKHRKLVPTGLERVIWACGDGSTLSLYDTPVGRLGALVCWENKMPLARTALYGKGLEVYCAPAADDSDLWLASMRHVAHEGGCFVLSANQFCLRKDYPPPPGYAFTGFDEEPSPDDVVCRGGSVIVSPSGEVLAGPKYDGEGLLTGDLDFSEIVHAKFDFDVVGHSSRPEVLTLVVKDQPQVPVTYASSASGKVLNKAS